MTPAGWYDDPAGPGSLRYWDGTAWTAQVQPVPPPVAWGQAPDDPHGGVPAMVHPGYGSDVAAAEPEDTYGAEPAGFGPGDWTRHPGGPPPVAGFDADWLATPLEATDFGTPEVGATRWRPRLQIGGIVVVVLLIAAVVTHVRLSDPTDPIERGLAAAAYAKSQKDGTGLSRGNAKCIARRVRAQADPEVVRTIADEGPEHVDLDRIASEEVIIGAMRTCLDDEQLVAVGKGFGVTFELGDASRCVVVQVFRRGPLAELVTALHEPEATDPASARVYGRAFDACEVGISQFLAAADIGSDAEQRACVASELAPVYPTSGQLLRAFQTGGPGDAAVNAALAACPS